MGGVTINPGGNPLGEVKGDLFDIRAEIEVGSASECGFMIRGEPVNYSVKEKKLTLMGNIAPLEPLNGRITLQILVDRTSIEVFANHGRVSITSYFTPKGGSKSIELFSRGGSAKVISLDVYKLRSIWPQAQDAQAKGTNSPKTKPI